MKKIDLNFIVKGLDGKELTDAHAGQIVGNVLASGSRGDAMKIMGWAFKMYAKESFEVDESDYIVLKDLIKDSDLVRLTKAQVLERLIEINKEN